MAEFYLTAEQVAERLQLHPETVRRQLKSGRLRGVRRGRVWRVPESALNEPVSTLADSQELRTDSPTLTSDRSRSTKNDSSKNSSSKKDPTKNAVTPRHVIARDHSISRNIRRDLALLKELDAFVSTLPDSRAQAGLPPLTDEEIFNALYED